MKIFLLIFFLIHIPFVSAYSQPQTEWEKRYADPNGHDVFFKDMTTDKADNIYITGYVKINYDNWDIITLKYDYSGALIWAKTFDGTFHLKDEPFSITADNSGNVIVAGYSYERSVFRSLVAIKYNANGDSVWVNRIIYQIDTSSCARFVATDDSNNVYVAGYFNKTTTGAGIFVKYNSSGMVKWVKYYGLNDNLNNDCNYFAITKNNFIYVQFAIGDVGSVTCKYNLQGNKIWERIDSTGGIKLLTDNTDNVIVGGDYFDGIYNGNNYVMLKYDSSGNKLWKRTYHHSSYSNNDNAYDIAIDNQGHSFITGVSGQTGQMGWDYLTLKYNPNGDTIFEKRYNPATASDDWAFSVTTDKYGCAYVTGKSNNYNLGYGYTTIKYAPNGTQQWVKRYDGGYPYSGNSEARKIIVDTNLNIYISGNSNISGVSEIATIKYSQSTGINKISKNIPDKFQLFQNYPNPFNPTTNIRYNVTPLNPPFAKGGTGGFVSIKIYNILGKEIVTLVNEKQTPGTYEVSFDGSNYSTGIYFYSLYADGVRIDTKKFVLLK